MGVDRLPTRFRGGLAPILPAFSLPVLWTVQRLLPLLLRVRWFPWLPAGITGIEVRNGDALARCYQRFAASQVRLILAFRHCEVDDPLLGLHLLGHDLPRRAARLQLSLPGPIHAHFLFDRGMPLWAGRPLGWVLSRLGGVSVHRGRHPDWFALRQARRLVLEGRFPFAMAPEGATNGLGETIGPLEPGVAQLAIWCVEDLQRDGRREEVLIVPIALQYFYDRPDWACLGRLMGSLESAIGLPSGGTAEPTDPCARLRRIAEAFIDRMEAFYALPPTPRRDGPGPGASPMDERIARLIERALSLAESRLAVRGEGGTEARCRRLEEAAWRWIHRGDLAPRHRLPPLERGLADWAAQEAALAERHMRLAECFVAVSANYVQARPSFERYMETTLLLHDGLARLRGDRLPARPRLGARHACITVGRVLSVSERWNELVPASEAARPPRQAVRSLIANLGEAIRRDFEAARI